MRTSFIFFFMISTTACYSTTDTNRTQEKTILEKEISAQNKAQIYPNIINLYNPSYVLPLYNSTNPYQAIYANRTPYYQRLKNEEFKAYFSFVVPLLRHLSDNKPLALNFAYSQLMYWQVYTKSPYFRETNYEPELFIEKYFSPMMSAQLGLNHQSNGKGNDLERSWNRGYTQLKLTGKSWLFKVRVWILLAQGSSSNLHNPHIAYYLGYENFLFSYNWNQLKLSIEAQNIESGFKRGFRAASLSYPILGSVSLFAQIFNGYGQSLIEYNHRTTGIGVGVSLNDWIN